MRLKLYLATISFLLLPLVANADSNELVNQPADPQAVQPPTGMIPKVLVRLGSGKFYSNKAIVVDKKTRTLSLWSQEASNYIKLVKTFPVDYGRKDGDKFVRNDLKTPEGVYFFQNTLTGEELNYNEYGNRAFTMDYPNFWDKKENKTGSGIWLHAIPETKTLKRGSRGCIVVRNEAIEELKSYISLKTMPIIVKDEISYVPANSKVTTENTISEWIQVWLQDWQTKNINNYITHYHSDFKSQRMDKAQWKTYKSRVNKKYNEIKVQIEEPLIVINNDEITVRFLQKYQSDKHQDFGEKTLYVKVVDGSYKIIHENWKPISKEVLVSLFGDQNNGQYTESL